LQRTVQYASFLAISRALHPDVFDQPGKKLLFQQPAKNKRPASSNGMRNMQTVTKLKENLAALHSA